MKETDDAIFGGANRSLLVFIPSTISFYTSMLPFQPSSSGYYGINWEHWGYKLVTANYFILFCIFPWPFTPFIPHSPLTVTTLLSMSMSPFSFFAQCLYFLPSPFSCHPSMSLSLFCLIVQFVC